MPIFLHTTRSPGSMRISCGRKSLSRALARSVRACAAAANAMSAAKASPKTRHRRLVVRMRVASTIGAHHFARIGCEPAVGRRHQEDPRHSCIGIPLDMAVIHPCPCTDILAGDDLEAEGIGGAP